jgi:hypothetical protein
MIRNLPGYLAYGDVTVRRSDPRTAHRPRHGRLARGPGQDRPAACPAGDDAPEQVALRDNSRNSFDYLPPLQTGWSETGVAHAIQTLGLTPCRADGCFAKTTSGDL